MTRDVTDAVLPDPYPYGLWTRYASEQIYKEAKRCLREPNYGLLALDCIESVAGFVRPVGAPWETTPIWPVLRYFLPAIERLAAARAAAGIEPPFWEIPPRPDRRKLPREIVWEIVDDVRAAARALLGCDELPDQLSIDARFGRPTEETP
jgi:hypothetical protein